MENLQDYLDEWKEVLNDDTSIPSISNHQNESIMQSFVQFENTQKKQRKDLIKVGSALIAVLLLSLLIFSLMSYFRGPDVVDHHLSSITIGTLLLIASYVVYAFLSKQIKVSRVFDNPSLQYLHQLKQDLKSERLKGRIKFIGFAPIYSIGLALFVDGVFHTGLLLPFWVMIAYLTIVVIFVSYKERDRQQKIENDIDALIAELSTD